MNMPSFQFTFEAIGTRWVIDIYDDAFLGEQKYETIKGEIIDEVKNRIELFEQTYSRFRSDSWLSMLSNNENILPFSAKLPSDAKPLFDLYQNLYELTNGKVTPLIGQVLVDAGYDEHYSLVQKKELVSPLALDDVMEIAPPTSKDEIGTITIKKNAAFDFGAVGKGYIIDIVSELLISKGIKRFCVDAGGDMRYSGEQILSIGFENPKDATQVLGVIHLQNKSIAGSAGNRRVWQGLHQNVNHIIDPITLTSPTHICAVSVVADSAMIADAMTTALYFTDPLLLKRNYEFEYLILRDDMSVEGTLVKSTQVELY